LYSKKNADKTKKPGRVQVREKIKVKSLLLFFLDTSASDRTLAEHKRQKLEEKTERNRVRMVKVEIV